jgi:hypothetical protein
MFHFEGILSKPSAPHVADQNQYLYHFWNLEGVSAAAQPPPWYCTRAVTWWGGKEVGIVDWSLLFVGGALVFEVRGEDGSDGVRGRRDEAEEIRDVSELSVRWYTVVYILDVYRGLNPLIKLKH